MVLDVLITPVANNGKGRVMLLIRAGHGNNSQIILKWHNLQ